MSSKILRTSANSDAYRTMSSKMYRTFAKRDA